MNKQQCVIPNLDPFHPDVLPFIRNWDHHVCNLGYHGNVMDGKLFLNMKNVQKAGFII